MFGKLLCWIGLHNWKSEYTGGGGAVFYIYECQRCDAYDEGD